MASKDWITKLGERWDQEASVLERKAKAAKDLSTIERRLMEMHARAKRGCAQDLRLEQQKVVNRGG
jgi:hypothetical protein